MTAAPVEELGKSLRSDGIQAEKKATSHRLAVKLYAEVQGLIIEGADPREIYDYLNRRFLEYRDKGQAIERDALVEVLDELEELLAA